MRIKPVSQNYTNKSKNPNFKGTPKIGSTNISNSNFKGLSKKELVFGFYRLMKESLKIAKRIEKNLKRLTQEIQGN